MEKMKINGESDVFLFLNSITKQHATLRNKGDVVSILPGQGKVLVNGEELKQPRNLKHQDR